MNAYEKLTAVYNSIKEKIPFEPKIALVLGSGLGDFAETVDIVSSIAYNDIEGFPVSTVEGHKGRFVFGYIEGVPSVIMQGRVHFYEGYSMQDVVLPIRLMKLFGAKVLFLTNAAGGINNTFKVGDFMLIRDHISFFAPSPLIGKNLDELGTRFPDMSCVYDKNLFEIVKNTAKIASIPLKEGVYCQVTGPNYETPAEIKLLSTLGADAVGMSTAVEAMTAAHCGLKTVGISLITDVPQTAAFEPLTHEQVTAAANAASAAFKKLVRESIVNIGKSL